MARKQSEADPLKPRGKRAERETPDPPASPIESAAAPVQEVIPGTGKPFPEREPVEGAVQRLSFAVSDTGVLDVDAIKKREFAARAKDVIKKSFSDPHVRQWAGVTDSAAPISLPVPPATIGFLFDMMSKLEASYFAKKLNIKDVDLPRVYGIVKMDAVEHEMIDMQAAQLIQKYIPAQWLEAADIWIFASTLVGLQVMKYQMLVATFGKPNGGESETGPLADANRKPNGSAGVAAVPIVDEAKEAA